ncbi:hypothetical protein [Pseudomonas sp.]|uniref:hypothetical protein n=1 Tax=Pseudomonas sp. TaxID=306 RepID=UPI001B0E7B6A|nr:hypothetical protein [Pseudomonas sp.]MBO9552237.1 tail assembly protein [Pseudomonas sp.]
MKTIHLHGALGSQFGGPFRLDVRDPAEAVRALLVQLPGFREALEAGHWHVLRGSLEQADALGEEGLVVALGAAEELHILPAIEGAGGVMNIVSGITMVVWGAMTGNYGMIKKGFNKTTGGVTSLFSQTPKSNDYAGRESADERPSFLFDGPTNTSTQGLPVPVIYGRVRTGSIVVSAGLTAEEA